MGVSVIVDDTVSFDFNYVGDQWTHQTGQSSVFNGTLSGITPPSLTFFFYGSDINFYGTLTSGLATGVNLFSLQNLTNAQFHSLELLPTAASSRSIMSRIHPTQYTVIATSLIIDDHDSSLQYSANWNSTTGNFKVGPPTMGSTMKFSFVGSAISVYGLLNQVDGRLSPNATATKFTPFNGSQTASPSTWLLSQHSSTRPRTWDHSLLVTLDDVSGSQMLWIDSVVLKGRPLLPTTTTSSSPSKFPNAAIGGIVVAVIVVVFLYACCCRRRRYLSSPLDQHSINYFIRTQDTNTNLVEAPPPPLPAPAPSLQPQNMFNIVYGDYPQINSPYTPRYTQEEIPRFPSQPPQDYRQRPVATTPVAPSGTSQRLRIRWLMNSSHLQYAYRIDPRVGIGTNGFAFSPRNVNLLHNRRSESGS
ncbi:hypothetical protein BDZ97DRAFT_1807333 [Flammula alnicola]|nr:hypothetical protein BDZ97DRAFT_1807333 [Flammula alnicola]